MATGGCPSCWKLSPQFPSAEAAISAEAALPSGMVSAEVIVSAASGEKWSCTLPAAVPARKAAANSSSVFAPFFKSVFFSRIFRLIFILSPESYSLQYMSESQKYFRLRQICKVMGGIGNFLCGIEMDFLRK